MVKCPFEGGSYGVRVEKRGDDWVRTWAFAIDDTRAKREGFDKSEIEGTLQPVDKFPGCPHCGTEGLMKCGCGKMLCCKDGLAENLDSAGAIECPWCGEEIGKITTVDSVEVGSGGF
jgi:transcription elongation factor Elf1